MHSSSMEDLSTATECTPWRSAHDVLNGTETQPFVSARYFHLDSKEPLATIRDEIERLVLGHRDQNPEALLREVELGVEDPEVPFGLRVVRAHGADSRHRPC